MTQSYDSIAWKDEGLWTAHSPSIPGVYGLGRTKARAERDLADALGTLFEYLKKIGEARPAPRRLVVGAVTVR